jgi:hypothetical protein
MSDADPARPAARVVDLTGAEIEAAPVEADPKIIELLEEALERARAGRLSGAAVLLIVPSASSNFDSFCNWYGPRLSLIAATSRLQHRLNLEADKTVDLDADID